jgi:hypothetical protein
MSAAAQILVAPTHKMAMLGELQNSHACFLIWEISSDYIRISGIQLLSTGVCIYMCIWLYMHICIYINIHWYCVYELSQQLRDFTSNYIDLNILSISLTYMLMSFWKGRHITITISPGALKCQRMSLYQASYLIAKIGIVLNTFTTTPQVSKFVIYQWYRIKLRLRKLIHKTYHEL